MMRINIDITFSSFNSSVILVLASITKSSEYSISHNSFPNSSVLVGLLQPLVSDSIPDRVVEGFTPSASARFYSFQSAYLWGHVNGLTLKFCPLGGQLYLLYQYCSLLLALCIPQMVN